MINLVAFKKKTLKAIIANTWLGIWHLNLQWNLSKAEFLQ